MMSGFGFLVICSCSFLPVVADEATVSGLLSTSNPDSNLLAVLGTVGFSSLSCLVGLADIGKGGNKKLDAYR